MAQFDPSETSATEQPSSIRQGKEHTAESASGYATEPSWPASDEPTAASEASDLCRYKKVPLEKGNGAKKRSLFCSLSAETQIRRLVFVVNRKTSARVLSGSPHKVCNLF